MREMLRFQANISQTVALAFDDGIAVEGRFGDQVMYTLEDQRVMYVPPVVRDQIQRLGIRRGEQFQIVKREKKTRNRRSIEWVVERSETREPAPPQPTTVSGEVASQVPDASGTAEFTTAVPVNGTPKPNRHGAAAEAVIPFAGTLQGQYILSALVNMVDVVVAVEAYARAKGRELHFTSEDIRALTITCFIQRARENGGAR